MRRKIVSEDAVEVYKTKTVYKTKITLVELDESNFTKYVTILTNYFIKSKPTFIYFIKNNL